MNIQLTMCDTSQGLVEGGRVAVISERDTHSSGKKPSGQSEGFFVLQEPDFEALIVHLVALASTHRCTNRLLQKQKLVRICHHSHHLHPMLSDFDVHLVGTNVLTMRNLLLK